MANYLGIAAEGRTIERYLNLNDCFDELEPIVESDPAIKAVLGL